MMMEALFGSPSSIWTTPFSPLSPGFGRPATFQHPVGFGASTIGPPGLGPQPLLANTDPIATVPRDAVANLNAFASSPYAPSSVMPWTIPVNVNPAQPLMPNPWAALTNIDPGFGVPPTAIV